MELFLRRDVPIGLGDFTILRNQPIEPSREMSMQSDWSKETLRKKPRSELVEIARDLSIDGLFSMDEEEIARKIHLKSKLADKFSQDKLDMLDKEIREEAIQKGNKDFIDSLKSKRRTKLLDMAKSLGADTSFRMDNMEIADEIKKELKASEEDLKIGNGRSDHTEDKEETGYVYVMVNSGKKGLVKIGMTEREPEKRAEELSSRTGIAVPFVVAYKAEVENPLKIEKSIHNELSDERINDKREFFKMSCTEAINTVQSIV